MSSGGSAIGALFFTIAMMVLFALMFSTFLIVPFFIFLAGLIAMFVSDRKNGHSEPEEVVKRDPDEDVEVHVVEPGPR